MLRNNSCIFLVSVASVALGKYWLVVVQWVAAVEVVVVVVAVLVSPVDGADQEGPGVFMEDAGEDCGAG